MSPESLEQAVADSLAHSPDREVAVIPEGPYVVPFFRVGEQPIVPACR